MSVTYYQGIFIAKIYSSFLHLIFVETRNASFKPIVQTVKKPISSVLEKIHLHKLEILEKFSGWYVMFPGGYFNGLLMILFFFAIHFRTNTPVEDSDDDASEPESDSTGHLGEPQVKQVAHDVKDLKIVSLYQWGLI
jgi:hypothetical protein